MRFSLRHLFFLLLPAFTFFASSGFAQINPVDSISTPLLVDEIAHRQDSATIQLNTSDSLVINIAADTIVPAPQRVKKSILDTKVDRVSDSSMMDLKKRKAYLYGNADVTYGTLNIKAAYIEIDFANNIAYATGIPDSTGKLIGTPILNENGQEYRAEEMRYNFETKKGIISRIITQEGEGYMHGTIVKKEADDVMNVKDGWYTTCDLDHPHYGLKFSKAKVIPNNKIVVGPAYVVIEDVPTPAVLPFALIPNKKERRSGILVPSFDQVNNMGFGLRDGGYYWHINDYMDLTVRGDIYTRGSWALRPNFNYKKLYKYNGRLQLGYARNLIGVEGTPSYDNRKDFNIKWSHSQDPKAHPVNRFSADVDIQSGSYSKYTPSSNTDFLTNTYRSSVSFSTSFGKFNYSINGGFTQNTQTHEVTINLPSMSLSSGQIFLFRKKVRTGSIKWYENISIKYSMTAANNIKALDSTLFDGSLYSKMDYGMKHNIPINATFKLWKVLNGSINVNYNEYWYGKTIYYDDYVDTAYYLIDGNLVKKGWAEQHTKDGFASTRDFNMSASINTKVYGMYTMAKGPIKAVRHVMTPAINFSYRPDFGKEFWNNYDTYTDDKGRQVRYSRYQSSLYGGPPDGESGLISFSLDNNLEMKVVSRRDTVSGTKKIKLIDNFRISIGYDIAADSLRWSRLALSGKTTIIDGLQLTYAGAFDPYAVNEEGTRINKTEWEVNKRLFRFESTEWKLSFDYRLNPDTFKKGKKNEETTSSTWRDIPVSERIYDPEYYIDWTVPWNLSFGYSLQYVHTVNYKNKTISSDPKLVQSINVSGDVSLTKKWKISCSTGYDFQNKQWNYTNINIYRDLHCWEMSLHWVPFGSRTQWGFKINIKANMLKDVKIEKKKDFRENW